MLLAAPLERTLPSAGICSAQTQRGMEGWREEKTRTSLAPAMGEAWCCAGEGMGGGLEEVVGGVFKSSCFQQECLKQQSKMFFFLEEEEEAPSQESGRNFNEKGIFIPIKSNKRFPFLIFEANNSRPETFNKRNFSELETFFFVFPSSSEKTSQSEPIYYFVICSAAKKSLIFLVSVPPLFSPCSASPILRKAAISTFLFFTSPVHLLLDEMFPLNAYQSLLCACGTPQDLSIVFGLLK